MHHPVKKEILAVSDLIADYFPIAVSILE